MGQMPSRAPGKALWAMINPGGGDVYIQHVRTWWQYIIVVRCGGREILTSMDSGGHWP
jgi:hypothetical protein